MLLFYCKPNAKKGFLNNLQKYIKTLETNPFFLGIFFDELFDRKHFLKVQLIQISLIKKYHSFLIINYNF